MGQNNIQLDQPMGEANRRYNLSNITVKTKKKASKLKIVTCLLFIAIFSMTYAFLLGWFIDFYYPYEFEPPFEKVKISSEYDFDNIDRLLPIVNLKLSDKNIKFVHKILPKDSNNESYSSTKNFGFFEFFSTFFKSLTSENFLHNEFKDKS